MSKAVFGKTNPSPESQVAAGVQRFASVTELLPEMEREYRELHANVWLEVLERLRSSHIENYSIHIVKVNESRYLFSYFEYVGNDYVADMAAIESCPHTQRWWKETDPCQRKLGKGQWIPAEMLFFME